jgi:signal transduction histidine kinase/ligand-binding sensor domain-containing protein
MRSDGYLYYFAGHEYGDPCIGTISLFNELFVLMEGQKNQIYIVATFLLAAVASAQQFSVTNWGHKDGLPSTTIYALAQSEDGFLWMGTGEGLIRFDGFQFIQSELPGVVPRPLGQVTALESTKSAGLVVGTAAGLLVRWSAKSTVNTMLNSPVEHIQELDDHTLQVETRDKVFRLQESNLSSISSAAKEEFRAGKHSQMEEQAFGQEAELHLPHKSIIRKIFHDTGGATWVATENNGLFRIAPGRHVQSFGRSTGLPSDHISDILEDREANIWVGTQNGLARLRADKFITYTVSSGLLSDIASSLAPASDGGVWIGSRSGLERFTGGRGAQYVLLKGIAVNGLLRLQDGSLLISTQNGIQKLLRGTHELRPVPDTRYIEQMAQSENGDLWLYGSHAGLWHLKNGSKPESINEPALAGQVVTNIHGGQHDQVWIGLENGDLILRPPAGSHIFTAAHEQPGGAVRFLSPQPDGTLWVATDKGLAYFDGEHFRSWNRSSGLPGDRLSWIIPDEQKNLWLGYSTGIARLSIGALLHSVPNLRLQYDFYDDGDGLKSNPATYGSSPVALTSDGCLWASMSEGVGMIDLGHVHLNPLPPPVHILDLNADGRNLTPIDGLSVPPNTRTLQISYTAISLTEPRKVRFRYHLNGFESGWQDAGIRRNAFYTNLRPGHYRFQVLAANNDGIWNNTGDSITFELLPAFYQTRWFLAVCVLFMVLVITVVYRLRMRFAARELQSRYEERMAERTRIAQDLHDNLIQEMMGVNLQLEIADAVAPAGSPAQNQLRRALDLSRTALANGRNALHILRQRPLSRLDIEGTLKDTAQRLTGSQNTIRLASSGRERSIQPFAGEQIVQIVREAVRNAMQYAGTHEVDVQSEYGDEYLTFVVRDNGPGISEEVLREGKSGHFGIRGMRERAAHISSTLAVNSSASTGTEWTLRIPATIAYEQDDTMPGTPVFIRSLRSLVRIPGRRGRR